MTKKDLKGQIRFQNLCVTRLHDIIVCLISQLVLCKIAWKTYDKVLELVLE